MADAHLEPGRLAAGQPSHLADKGHHLQRRRERPVIGRRDAVLAHRNTADLGNFYRDLGRRQHAAMTGLGALADLELDHLDLIVGRDPGELVRIKLEFFKPFTATNTAEFTFKPEGALTVVTWSMSGQNNFIAKAVHLFMDMDKMVGKDFEAGLANLKAVTEK